MAGVRLVDRKPDAMMGLCAQETSRAVTSMDFVSLALVGTGRGIESR
jgi:hypothetical protein